MKEVKPKNMKIQLKQILSKTREEIIGKMVSSNSIQLFALMMMVTMGGLNLCMANPVKEDKLAINKDLPIKLKERLFNVTSKESEDAMGKPESGATYIKEEESKKKASWETARCCLDSRSLF